MLSRWKSKDKSEKTGKSSSSSGKKKRKGREHETDWHGDGLRDVPGHSDGETRGQSRARPSRRDDSRRHTLCHNNFFVHEYHHSQLNSLDMEYKQQLSTPEYATVKKYREMKQNRVLDLRLRKPPLPRGYAPQNNAMLFDDDPGIMSEVETSSTGFRRGGKQRSSLPVVRTPSKTLERPLGLVFLQYRNETKRALLPNEITSIDTVKALFVRSFPKQLSMPYMESPLVKIYIHDSSKDMFYELEDVRAHLHDIRDRSVLRLFESTDIGGGVFPGAVGVGSLAMPTGAAGCSGPSSWDQDQSYFSEPEIDSEYHHQHVHKTKVKAPAYYMGTPAPSTLPRGGSLLRAFSPAAPPVPADRIKTISGSISGHSDAYMSSPERSGPRGPYEDPYYAQFLSSAPSRTNITPIIDEEVSDAIIDDAYQMYSVNPVTTAPRPMPRPSYDARVNNPIEDMQRLRVEKMERQLANLTGLVQKALQVPGPAIPTAAPRQECSNYIQGRSNHTQDAGRFGSTERPPKLGRDKFQKSVSFEKSVSFSDDPPDMNSPKQHSPKISADSKPAKPAIKSSTLPRTSSQERDRLKPAPPPKPAGLVGTQISLVSPQKTFTIHVPVDFFNNLRVLQDQSRDLRLDTLNLRRVAIGDIAEMRNILTETILKIDCVIAGCYHNDADAELKREEEQYRRDIQLYEEDLHEMEANVECLRGQAASNTSALICVDDVESIAAVVAEKSARVGEWQKKLPALQEALKTKLGQKDMDETERKRLLLEGEPERLETVMNRYKKLTGTLVTLKRLAYVQEQRIYPEDEITTESQICFGPGASPNDGNGPLQAREAPHAHDRASNGRGPPTRGSEELRAENALDALLDELQTFMKPPGRGEGPLRRLHSYPSGSDTDASPPVRARGHHLPKPPVPDRHPELLAMVARRAPPPPPPRTTSRSPLASPTSPAAPVAKDPNHASVLEQRHQELLKKQKALQEQYARLQMIQRSGPSVPARAQPDLKKTGSESNLLTKMNFNLAPSNISGSMTHLASDDRNIEATDSDDSHLGSGQQPPKSALTTNKVYETDIL